jgi:hypothetical protein
MTEQMGMPHSVVMALNARHASVPLANAVIDAAEKRIWRSRALCGVWPAQLSNSLSVVALART